jgi:ethanolamine ammonia-lyase small subunit
MALDLRSFTPARVALGRSGHSLPTADWLTFQLDHARARDAVYEELDPGSLPKPHVLLRSAARDRSEYLRRPDLGSSLIDSSRLLLESGEYDAAIVIADGLSATAVHRHATPLWEALQQRLAPEDWHLAPVSVVCQGELRLATKSANGWERSW